LLVAAIKRKLTDIVFVSPIIAKTKRANLQNEMSNYFDARTKI